MKYIVVVLWTFSLFLLMFSSFPFRVECRPRAMGPGPPSASLITATTYDRDRNHSTRRQQQQQCSLVIEQYFGRKSNKWPLLYRTDITLKYWDSPLVLEGTARSKSELRLDGTFGITFDLHRLWKGDTKEMLRRKQFRLQFLENPITNSSNELNPNRNRNRHGRNNRINVNFNNNSTIKNNNNNIRDFNSNSLTSHLLSGNGVVTTVHNLEQHFRSSSSTTRGASANSGTNSIIKSSSIRNGHAIPQTNSGIMYANSSSIFTQFPRSLTSDIVTSNNGKCHLPPRATVKTGRKYFIFVAKVDNRLIPVFPPELANKRNIKAVESTLCKGCGQAPSVGAAKTLTVKAKEKLRIRCRLRAGNPIPSLNFYHNGNPVNLFDNRYRIRAKRRQSILVIRKAKESDAGIYRCEAKNSFGSAYAVTKVTVSSTATTAIPRRVSLLPPHPPYKSTTAIAAKPTETTPSTLWAVQSIPCPFETYCLNGGTCSYYDSIGEYVCQCAEGYKGQRCDTKDIHNSGSTYLSLCTFGKHSPQYPC